MRRRSRLAYYVSGADAAAIERGLHCLVQTSSQPGMTGAWLVTPARFSLRGAVQEILGEEAVTALLLRNDTVSLRSSNLPIKHYTEDTLPYVGVNLAVLVLCPTQKLLDRLDNLHGVAAITLVSDDAERLQPWVEKWQAIEALSDPAPS